MLKPFLLFLCGLFSAQMAIGQGTYLFTWQGNSNYFQATFSVTDAEMQPGATFNSSLFYSSISVTSPSGTTYRYDNPSDWATGGCYANGTGWNFGAGLIDPTHGTEISASGQQFGGGAGLIHEKPFSGPDLWYETGYWTTTYVPEPSTAMLSALGALAFSAGRHSKAKRRT